MRYPRFIILISLIGTIIITGVFGLPKYREYLNETQKFTNIKSFVENQTQYYKEIEEMFKKLETKRNQVDKINAMLPTQFDGAALINYFNETSKNAGLLLKNLTISSGGSLKDKERIHQYTLSLSLDGTYLAFKSFLQSIERSSRLFEIEKISFSTEAKNEINEFELIIRIYSY